MDDDGTTLDAGGGHGTPDDADRKGRPPASPPDDTAGRTGGPADRGEASLDEEDLDEALEESFPASDPLPPPSTPGR